MTTLSITNLDPIAPTEAEAEQAKLSSRQLALQFADAQGFRLQIDNNSNQLESLVLPRAAVRLLCRVLTEMAQGNAVTLVPIHAELTTQEAAALLNVSRPFLVKLLDEGIIPSRKVGSHRRALFEDIMAYKRDIDNQRLKVLEELAAVDQELGTGILTNVEPVTAIYDACVLYPAPLRSLLMYLALTDLFQARWSETIHEEWMRSVQRDYPEVTPAQAERVRDLMNAHVRDCLVTGYEGLIADLTLPDPDDRHVLASAIHTKANVIVTCNLKDFPNAALAPYQIEPLHPDEFVKRLLDAHPGAVCGAVQKQRLSLKNPPKTVDEFLAILERCGLPLTVASLRLFSDLL